jgi:anti-anti-sigma factor
MPMVTRPDGVLLATLSDDPQLGADLDSLVQDALSSPPAVVLNLSGVGYLNSSHLARLLRLRKRVIVADGRLVLCRVTSPVLGVFHATGLDKVFTIVDDEGTAIEWAKMRA